MGDQGALVEPLQRSRGVNTQGIGAVTSSQIPGIPKFSTVSVALELQRRRQLLSSITPLESKESGCGDLKFNQIITQTPGS